MQFRSPDSARRRAFGVIDLVVGISVNAMLVGFFVGAVSGVRQAATRTQSINNEKQIALAFHNFHDVHKHLPFNGSDAAVNNVKYTKAAQGKSATSGSWAFQILPYLDEDAMFQNVDRKKGVGIYLCPGRARPQVETSNGGGAWTDYFYNGYLNDPMNVEKPDAPDAKRTLVNIADGSSNTIMVGHGNIKVSQYKADADVTLSTNIFNGGTTGTMRAGKNGAAKPAGVTLRRDSDKAPELGSWGGPFPQGGLFAFCDGAVRIIPYNFENLNALLTPAGNEEVVIPD